jgi:Thioredoxin
MPGVEKTAVMAFVEKNPGFMSMYDAYQPDLAMIEKIRAALPAGHVVVVAEYWCGDSRRSVPRMARVLDHLPGWTADVQPWNSTTRAKPLIVRAIPTFIIYRSGEEIGRIVETPSTGALERDLLAIATGQQ